MLEKAKIEKQTTIELRQLEASRHTAGPRAQDKNYMPHLPPLTMVKSC